MRWIVIDGIDGSGKSTVAKWTAEHYTDAGEMVLVRAHPSSGMAGRLARAGLAGRGAVMRTIATVFFILDVLASVSRLRRCSEAYGTVIFVRYIMATAYLPEGLMHLGYDFFARLLPVPRRLLLVDVDAGDALERIRKRGEKEEMFEDLASLEKTRRKVLALANGGWDVLENTGQEAEVRARLLTILEKWDASEQRDRSEETQPFSSNLTKRSLSR